MAIREGEKSLWDIVQHIITALAVPLILWMLHTVNQLQTSMAVVQSTVVSIDKKMETSVSQREFTTALDEIKRRLDRLEGVK